MLRNLYARYLNRRGRISPVRTIVLGFFLIILLGACILCMPISSASGAKTDFLTSLFTATSATCVTGLSVVETGAHWSSFGQAVLLVLIQLGGLGFMTVVTGFFFLMGRRIGLRERMVIAQAYSFSELSSVMHLLKRAVLWTFFLEGAGAVFLTFRFLFDMSFGRAVWYGVFHSVSAFCNAGFDILASVETGGSLTAYATDPFVNAVLMFLINFGGLGFFVWDDLFRNRKWNRLSVYTKLVLLINGVLLVGGFLLLLLLEWSNPATIGTLPVWQKILLSMFQSVTTRTAGFYTVPQGDLTGASLAVTDVLMFIGGASGSTAGGVKTVTFGIVALSAMFALRGRSHVTVFRREISQRQIQDATAIVCLIFALSLCGALVLSSTNGIDFSVCLYETVSALGTVGLSTGITPGLNVFSRLLLIVFMFFGRVGIMTIGLAFLYGDRAQDRFRYAEEKMLIG